MPRGDGTGPQGMGPAGFGCGFGRGRGFRRMFYATGVPGWTRYGYADANGESEKATLKKQANLLEKQFEQVKNVFRILRRTRNSLRTRKGQNSSAL